MYYCASSIYFFERKTNPPRYQIVVVMSWCTSGVWLQVLPFIDHRHLGSIPHFQWFSCISLCSLISDLRLHIWSQVAGQPLCQISPKWTGKHRSVLFTSLSFQQKMYFTNIWKCYISLYFQRNPVKCYCVL